MAYHTERDGISCLRDKLISADSCRNSTLSLSVFFLSVITGHFWFLILLFHDATSKCWTTLNYFSCLLKVRTCVCVCLCMWCWCCLWSTNCEVCSLFLKMAADSPITAGYFSHMADACLMPLICSEPQRPNAVMTHPIDPNFESCWRWFWPTCGPDLKPFLP